MYCFLLQHHPHFMLYHTDWYGAPLSMLHPVQCWASSVWGAGGTLQEERASLGLFRGCTIGQCCGCKDSLWWSAPGTPTGGDACSPGELTDLDLLPTAVLWPAPHADFPAHRLWLTCAWRISFCLSGDCVSPIAWTAQWCSLPSVGCSPMRSEPPLRNGAHFCILFFLGYSLSAVGMC